MDDPFRDAGDLYFGAWGVPATYQAPSGGPGTPVPCLLIFSQPIQVSSREYYDSLITTRINLVEVRASEVTPQDGGIFDAGGEGVWLVQGAPALDSSRTVWTAEVVPYRVVGLGTGSRVWLRGWAVGARTLGGTGRAGLRLLGGVVATQGPRLGAGAGGLRLTARGPGGKEKAVAAGSAFRLFSKQMGSGAGASVVAGGKLRIRGGAGGVGARNGSGVARARLLSRGTGTTAQGEVGGSRVRLLGEVEASPQKGGVQVGKLRILGGALGENARSGQNRAGSRLRGAGFGGKGRATTVQAKVRLAGGAGGSGGNRVGSGGGPLRLLAGNSAARNEGRLGAGQSGLLVWAGGLAGPGARSAPAETAGRIWGAGVGVGARGAPTRGRFRAWAGAGSGPAARSGVGAIRARLLGSASGMGEEARTGLADSRVRLSAGVLSGVGEPWSDLYFWSDGTGWAEPKAGVGAGAVRLLARSAVLGAEASGFGPGWGPLGYSSLGGP